MSGILRYNIYPDYKANRGKKYEFGDNQTDYDKYIANYCKNILSKNKRKETVREESEDAVSYTHLDVYKRQVLMVQLILIVVLNQLFHKI